jgi:hypothetical protein
MKKGILILLILISFFGCDKSQTKNFEEIQSQIQAKVDTSASYLANLEAIYGLAFTNYKSNTIRSDDLYIREDEAKVLYGYALEESKIKVNDNGILEVSLPSPKQLAIDKRILFISNVHDGYRPQNEKEERYDVDAELNMKLNDALNKHESKTIDMTKKMSRQYFEALATRFGLELELSFVN